MCFLQPTCPAFSLAAASVFHSVQTLPSRDGQQTDQGSSTINRLWSPIVCHEFLLSANDSSVSAARKGARVIVKSSKRKVMSPSSPSPKCWPSTRSFAWLTDKARTFVIYLVDVWTSCLASSTNSSVLFGVGLSFTVTLSAFREHIYHPESRPYLICLRRRR